MPCARERARKRERGEREKRRRIQLAPDEAAKKRVQMWARGSGRKSAISPVCAARHGPHEGVVAVREYNTKEARGRQRKRRTQKRE